LTSIIETILAGQKPNQSIEPADAGGPPEQAKPNRSVHERPIKSGTWVGSGTKRTHFQVDYDGKACVMDLYECRFVKTDVEAGYEDWLVGAGSPAFTLIKGEIVFKGIWNPPLRTLEKIKESLHLDNSYMWDLINVSCAKEDPHVVLRFTLTNEGNEFQKLVTLYFDPLP